MTGSVEFVRLPSNAFATDHPVACPPEDCSNGIVRRFYVLAFLKKHVIPLKLGDFIDVRSWPNPAVRLSITGRQDRKTADNHEGLNSHPKFIVNLLPKPLIKD